MLEEEFCRAEQQRKEKKQESEGRQQELNWQFDMDVSIDKNSKREHGTGHQ